MRVPGVILDKTALFEALLQRSVHEYFDTDGRPVGEGRARAFSRVETTFRSCPYAGSRYRHAKPMNASALQSILPEWQHSLSVLSWLSQRYQAFYHKRVTSHYDLALISGMGVFLTDYMVLRRSQPLASTAIPVWMSGLYKVCLGFQQATFLAMMNDCFKSRETKVTLPDAKGFYASLEAQGLLIGEAEVCGGSEEMINKAYDAMRGLHPARDNLASPPSWSDLAIDWDAYDAFTFHASNLWRQAILFAIHLQGFCIALDEASVPAALSQAVEAYLNARFARLLEAQSGLAVDMARLTLAESGRSFEEWAMVKEAFLREIAYRPAVRTDTDALSDVILDHLALAIDLSTHQAAVARALRKRLAEHQAFETAGLQTFNDHADAMLEALGYEPAEKNLTPEDLSCVFGKTLRQWPEFMP